MKKDRAAIGTSWATEARPIGEIIRPIIADIVRRVAERDRLRFVNTNEAGEDYA